MAKAKWARVGGMALVLGVALVACRSDAVTGSEVASPSLGKRMWTPDASTVRVALRKRPLRSDRTESKVIGPKGGSISIPEAGLKVIVPEGAISRPVAFSVTAIGGKLVAYEFEPHGTHFAVPLRVEQKKDRIILPAGGDPTAGYFSDRQELDDNSSVGVIEEERPVLDLVSAEGKVLVFSVEHFSGYLVASGRKK
jgi:hypothetical protein